MSHSIIYFTTLVEFENFKFKKNFNRQHYSKNQSSYPIQRLLLSHGICQFWSNLSRFQVSSGTWISLVEGGFCQPSVLKSPRSTPLGLKDFSEGLTPRSKSPTPLCWTRIPKCTENISTWLSWKGHAMAHHWIQGATLSLVSSTPPSVLPDLPHIPTFVCTPPSTWCRLQPLFPVPEILPLPPGLTPMPPLISRSLSWKNWCGPVAPSSHLNCDLSYCILLEAVVYIPVFPYLPGKRDHALFIHLLA